MERSRVAELHYMTPLANLASIHEHGILSHVRAAALPHYSVANEEVQDRREGKTVPQGRPLHEYANLYFDARNAMMYDRRCPDLLVIRVSPEVLDWQGVVITDGNAANRPTRFFASPEGLQFLDEERVYAEWWIDSDYWEHKERKRQRQAEVLVPDCVDPGAIIGLFARSASISNACHMHAPNWPVEVNRHVYFDA